MDTIYIKGISAKGIIGTLLPERQRVQKVIVDVSIDCDLRKAGKTDALADTLDYKALTEQITALIKNSRFFLIEKLASEIAKLCLKDKRTKSVRVTVTKPDALKNAQGAAIEIYRNRRQKAFLKKNSRSR